MRRKQLFELHDYGWFPALWRDMITDVLSEFEEDTRIYAPVAGLLAPLAEREDEFAIVDLCSGGGHPIVIVLNAMDEDIAARTRVTLTDSFHHFDRDTALAILRDAIEKGQGIGIFEYTERRLF